MSDEHADVLGFPFGPTEDELRADVGRRADELIGDLESFTRSALTADPACDDREAFERWTIHSLAGLQLVVEKLNRDVVRLGAIVDQRRR